MASAVAAEHGLLHHLSPRLARLREQVMERKGSFVADPNPFERDAALAQVPRGLSVVETRARLLRELAGLASIRMPPEWRLAGEHLPHGFGLPGAGGPGGLAELGLDPAEAPEIEARVRQWNGRGGAIASLGPARPEDQTGHGSWDHPRVFIGSGWMENHSIRDYPKVLRMGFGGIRRQVEARMARADITEPAYPAQESFWRAALAVCDAGITLGRRYAKAARKAGRDEAAAACQRVPGEGARTLFEAVQSLWLAHILTCGEDDINANSIGRLDRMLQPYYEADLAAGRIDRAGAVELMEELACKLYLDYDVQAITLAGVDEEGRDGVCAMSGIIVEATGNVGFVRDLSVRLGPTTPPDFIQQCARLVVRGGGIPYFFNDRCFLPALVSHGVPLAEARDYAPIGCIELTIPGKANPHAVSGWLSAIACLELALFDGRDPLTGGQWGPHTGLLTELPTWEALYAAFDRQLELFSRQMVLAINRGEMAQQEQGPLPAWSVLTDDCIERGRDITDGGARHFWHSVCLLGTPNVADSLAAIRRLVYEERRVDAGRLLAALQTDFAGEENLRQLLLTGAPKYGNDVEEVDRLAARVANRFIDLMDGFRSPLGGRFFVHLFTFLQNVGFGRTLAATPDGRKAGEPIAYSLSAQQGRDERGATALLSSISRLPHARAAGATAAIVDLDPRMVEGDDGAARLAHLVTAAFEMGVGQVQVNVVSAERLRLAQECPEQYGNIPVRVAGYSQMFRLLDHDLQEHVIARVKHTS